MYTETTFEVDHYPTWWDGYTHYRNILQNDNNNWTKL